VTESAKAARRRRRRDDEVARYRKVLLDRDRAAELCELLARTWPPRSLIELDGWQLRTAPGLPAHAGSAWPRSDGGRVPLHVRLDGTRRHYAQSGLTPRVLISEAARPAGVEAALAERGWARRDDAEIRTAELSALTALRADSEVTLAVDESPDDGWLDAWASLTGRHRRGRDAAAAALGRLAVPAVFVRAWQDDRLVGVARGVVDGGWLGLPDVVVAGADPDVPSAMARAIAGWARDRQVDEAWWLVPARGEPAAAEAVRRAGLRPALRLHLRVAGEAAAGGGSEAARNSP
jgi:hypothetical protein